MTYIIGDVHGCFKTLQALIEKLPQEAHLIFVGDLIDRGTRSADVVSFVREKGYLCVLGNHEDAMITHGHNILKAYEQGTLLPQHNVWYSNGGIETLLSYGVIQLIHGRPTKVDDFATPLKRFKEDIKWMESLPLFIELDLHVNNKPVVVSHGCIDTAWAFRKVDSMYTTLHRIATTSRREPDEDAKIFNIFGHTPMCEGAKVTKHFVNVDTGCYMGKDDEIHGYKKLSAYCIETQEVISQAYM